MEQVRLCTVCPMENWLDTYKTTNRVGWVIWICYSRALERRCPIQRERSQCWRESERFLGVDAPSNIDLGEVENVGRDWIFQLFEVAKDADPDEEGAHDWSTWEWLINLRGWCTSPYTNYAYVHTSRRTASHSNCKGCLHKFIDYAYWTLKTSFPCYLSQSNSKYISSSWAWPLYSSKILYK